MEAAVIILYSRKKKKKRENIPNASISSFHSPVNRSDRVISCSGWRAERIRIPAILLFLLLLSRRTLSRRMNCLRQICIDSASKIRSIFFSRGNESEIKIKFLLKFSRNERNDRNIRLKYVYKTREIQLWNGFRGGGGNSLDRDEIQPWNGYREAVMFLFSRSRARRW